MRHTLHNRIAVSVPVAPLLRTTTVTGSAVDCTTNVGSCAFAFVCGANTDGTFTPKLTESAASGGPFTDVASGDVRGTALVAMTANTTQTVSYAGSLQFVKPVITVTSSPGTGANVGVVAIKGHLSVNT